MIINTVSFQIFSYLIILLKPHFVYTADIIGSYTMRLFLPIRPKL